MKSKQVPIDGGLHFNAELKDDGHVVYTLDTDKGAEVLAQYCTDTQELTLFEVKNEKQATGIVQTQLNHTTAGILGKNPMLAALAALFGEAL